MLGNVDITSPPVLRSSHGHAIVPPSCRHQALPRDRRHAGPTRTLTGWKKTVQYLRSYRVWLPGEPSVLQIRGGHLPECHRRAEGPYVAGKRCSWSARTMIRYGLRLAPMTMQAAWRSLLRLASSSRAGRRTRPFASWRLRS